MEVKQNELKQSITTLSSIQTQIKTIRIKKLIFFLALTTNLLTNVPCGIIPASTVILQDEFNLNKVQIGFLGSLVYIGVVTGSIFSMAITNKLSSKQLVVGFLVADVGFLVLFNYSKNFFLLCLARYGAGFFKIFLVIYFPVWIDLHGMNYKSIWLTFLQIGVPLGIFMGYSMETILDMNGLSWRYGFSITAIWLFLNAVIFLCIPNKYLEVNQDIIQKTVQNEVSEQIMNESQNSLSPSENIYRSKKKTYFQNLKRLLKRKVFVCCSLSLSAIFFVVTNIQFWIKDYLTFRYEKPESTVFVTYAIIILSGPITGVIIGGLIVNKFGGYTDPKAIYITTGYGVLASIFGIPFPLVNMYYPAVVCLWFTLFFGGALMPCIIGIMISSVPKYLRTFASSNAQTFQNLFGYSPAPLLYGIICDNTGGNTSIYGMVFTMFWSLWGVLGLLTTLFLKRTHYKTRLLLNTNHNQEEEEGEGEEEHENVDQLLNARQRTQSVQISQSVSLVFGTQQPEFYQRKSSHQNRKISCNDF